MRELWTWEGVQLECPQGPFQGLMENVPVSGSSEKDSEGSFGETAGQKKKEQKVEHLSNISVTSEYLPLQGQNLINKS
jgi:hypothetical protein